MFSSFSTPTTYQHQSPFSTSSQRTPLRFPLQTPSPLRTSYCLNRMSAPRQGQKPQIPSSPLASYQDLNRVDENEDVVKNDGGSTGIIGPKSQVERTPKAFYDVNTPSTTSTTGCRSSTFTPPITTSSLSIPSNKSQRFAFEQRSRASSPAAQISSHALASRERQKRKFLDRIRARREEESDLRFGDSLLRMDYLEERRRWEREMAWEAGQTQDADINLDGGEDGGADMDQQMSPTEDKEVEELLALLDEQQSTTRGDAVDEDMDGDSEWDQVFAEFVSSQGRDVDMT